jgi:colanic acid/amylovoran biosynthesis glycosyltransferase
LLGAQSHSKVQALLQESDIFILPSVTASNGDKEGIPVSIMEAMRDELIVISTKHSGIPELIEDGKNGFLVEERSPELIVQKLRDIIVMKESELADIRLNAFRKVASEFDISQLNIQLIKYCKGKLLKS